MCYVSSASLLCRTPDFYVRPVSAVPANSPITEIQNFSRNDLCVQTTIKVLRGMHHFHPPTLQVRQLWYTGLRAWRRSARRLVRASSRTRAMPPQNFRVLPGPELHPWTPLPPLLTIGRNPLRAVSRQILTVRAGPGKSPPVIVELRTASLE